MPDNIKQKRELRGIFQELINKFSYFLTIQMLFKISSNEYCYTRIWSFIQDLNSPIKEGITASITVKLLSVSLQTISSCKENIWGKWYEIKNIQITKAMHKPVVFSLTTVKLVHKLVVQNQPKFNSFFQTFWKKWWSPSA